jgi:asparagine synthetase B (glutamine-hydrolysing)
MELIDLIDYPALRYASLSDSEVLDQGLSSGRLPPGQYAFALRRGRSIHLARDPIGCNKLFFGRNREGHLVVGNRAARVWQQGVPLAAIASCPQGHVLEYRATAYQARGRDSRCRGCAELSVGDFQRTRTLDGHCVARAQIERCQFAVCLSGGLDGSVIACSLPHICPGDRGQLHHLDADGLRRHAMGAGGAACQRFGRFRAAVRVASTLGLPLLPVVRRVSSCRRVRPARLALLDWRDFNAAPRSICSSWDIRAAFPGRSRGPGRS